MKIKLNKFLTIVLFLSLTLFVAQNSYASEVLGTLSTGTQASAVNLPENNLASLTDSSTINSAVSNLLGTGNNSAVMIEGMLVGALLTFFVGLLIFMIVLFIRRGRKKIYTNENITI